MFLRLLHVYFSFSEDDLKRRQMERIRNIPSEELEYVVHDLMPQIISIFYGETDSERHKVSPLVSTILLSIRLASISSTSSYQK